MLSTHRLEIRAFIQNSERRKKKRRNTYILYTNGILPAVWRFLTDQVIATKTLDSVAFHT